MGDVTHMLPNAEGADLLTSIKEVRPFIERRIVESLTASRHDRLAGAMMHLIEGGGKRMRATLPWLVGRAVGDTHSGLLDIGAAIETIHNFTLVHDDIMDDDEIRRGEMPFISNTICRQPSMQVMQCLQSPLNDWYVCKHRTS